MDKSLTSSSYSFEKFRTFLLLINNENVSRIRSIIRTDIHSHTHSQNELFTSLRKTCPIDQRPGPAQRPF